MIQRVRNHLRIVAALAAIIVLVLVGGAFVAWRQVSQFDDKAIRPSDTAAKNASTTLGEPGTLHLALQPVVSGLRRPIGIEPFPDGRLAVLEKGGRIRVIDGTTLIPEPFLDITPLVRSTGSEDGLVGLAFHPAYATNGRFFVTYTTEPLGVKIVEYRADGNRAEPGSARLLLEYATAKEFHLGGTLAFGKDGYLYISAGEGGPHTDPKRVAQDPQSLRGKILRIDVDGAQPYAIPPGNAYPDGSGGARPEVLLRGFRNPWRMSFDSETGDLWIPDVGQNAWEELNLLPEPLMAGANFGWSTMEGDYCYRRAGCERPALITPAFAYPHAAGCAVIGGYVYRGKAIPALQGSYLFSDYCDGGLYLLRRDGDSWKAEQAGATNGFPTSFGRGIDGELYLAGDKDGTIYRIVAAP